VSEFGHSVRTETNRATQVNDPFASALSVRIRTLLQRPAYFSIALDRGP